MSPDGRDKPLGLWSWIATVQHGFQDAILFSKSWMNAVVARQICMKYSTNPPGAFHILTMTFRWYLDVSQCSSNIRIHVQPRFYNDLERNVAEPNNLTRLQYEYSSVCKMFALQDGHYITLNIHAGTYPS